MIAEKIVASPADSATTQIYGVATLVLFGSVIYYLHILARHLKGVEHPARVPLALALIAYGVTVVPFIVLLILASLLPEYPVLLSGLMFTSPLIILTGSLFVWLHARKKRDGSFQACPVKSSQQVFKSFILFGL